MAEMLFRRKALRKPNDQPTVIQQIVPFFPLSVNHQSPSFHSKLLQFPFIVVCLFHSSVFSFSSFLPVDSPKMHSYTLLSALALIRYLSMTHTYSVVMSRTSYQIELLHPPVWRASLCTHTHTQEHPQTERALPCLQEEWSHVSFLLTPAAGVAERVVGCRSKVTGQDVAVAPFPLLMCSSVALATDLREVELLNEEKHGRGERGEKVDQSVNNYRRKCHGKTNKHKNQKERNIYLIYN